MQIHILPARSDNYIYLIEDHATQTVAAVDPSDAAPVLEWLEGKSLKLTHIFSTHHHGDHVGGNTELKAHTGSSVIGFAGDSHRIPAIDRQVEEGEQMPFAGTPIEVLFIPGHTLGHIAYYFRQQQWLFCGDTLFSMGCGRLFEGTAEQMHTSLQKLAALPGDTQIYCGHEYTEANGRFALTLEPENEALQQRIAEVKALRAQAKPTLPSTIGLELATNPFLRTESADIRRHSKMENASSVEVFAEIRKRKDVF